MMRMLTASLLLLVSLTVSARDLTPVFKEIYKNGMKLSEAEKESLNAYSFYLVPGILSESFLRADKRSKFDFSFLTSDYFSAQKKLLDNNGLSVERLLSSSSSVDEIRANIRRVIAKDSNKKIFITHSLGGLALLEELVHSKQLENISGIIFYQSPFLGSPVADTFLTYPYQMDRWLKPVLPFFNTTEETIAYLGTKSRTSFMAQNQEEIRELLDKIPVITVSGVANKHLSLFRYPVSLIEHGCIKSSIGVCLTRELYKGERDESDGMVPFRSSKLLDADFVRLEGADHGETVVSIPYSNFEKKSTLVALLKLLLKSLDK